MLVEIGELTIGKKYQNDLLKILIDNDYIPVAEQKQILAHYTESKFKITKDVTKETDVLVIETECSYQEKCSYPEKSNEYLLQD